MLKFSLSRGSQNFNLRRNCQGFKATAEPLPERFQQKAAIPKGQELPFAFSAVPSYILRHCNRRASIITTMPSLQKKICLLGTFGVGKTSLVRRFVENHFEDKYLSTIGVKVSRKQLAVAAGTLDLLVWDIANADELGTVEKSYFRGAHGALVVHDLTRPESCERLAVYCRRFLEVAPRARLVFAGNKLDLIEAPQPSPEEYLQFTAGFSAPHFFTSAKTGAQVEHAFQALAEAILAAP